jgi:hypothetical protein
VFDIASGAFEDVGTWGSGLAGWVEIAKVLPQRR